MKRTPLLQITVLAISSLASATSLCMQNDNSNIGFIDTLMLKRTVSQDTLDVTEQKINAHQFKVPYENIAGKFEYTNPYIVKHNLPKNDQSDLAQAVSHMIYKTTVREIGLRIDNHANSHHDNCIDECTTWNKATECDDVECTARFYNKAALVATL